MKQVISLILVLCLSLTGCGFVIKDYYMRTDTESKNGYLLNGSFPEWIPINDLFTSKTDGLTINVKINNYYQRVLLIGPWLFAVIPLFGIPKSGYNGKISNGKKGVIVTVAVYGDCKETNSEVFSFEPLKTKLTKNNRILVPVSYTYSYLEHNGKSTTPLINRTSDTMVTINEKFKDILIINIIFAEPVPPSGRVKIKLPPIKYNLQQLKLDPIVFKEDRGYTMGVAL